PGVGHRPGLLREPGDGPALGTTRGGGQAAWPASPARGGPSHWPVGGARVRSPVACPSRGPLGRTLPALGGEPGGAPAQERDVGRDSSVALDPKKSSDGRRSIERENVR